MNASDLPHSLEAEEHLLSCCLNDVVVDGVVSSADTLNRCIDAKLSPGSFDNAKHGIIFRTALSLHSRRVPVSVASVLVELSATGELAAIGGSQFLTSVSGRTATTAQAPYFIAAVRDQARAREALSVAAGITEALSTPNADVQDVLDRARNRIEQLAVSARCSDHGRDELLARVSARRFRFADIPPEPIPRLYLNGKPISTVGNLTNVIAQAKAGKTAFIAAIVAAVLSAQTGNGDRDTLGIRASDPGRLRILWIDTEQSTFDHDKNARRAMRRAGVESLPGNFEFYSLAGFSAEDLCRSLHALMEESPGLFLVIIDGTADLVADVNDPEECNAFVAQLQGLAIKHGCAIINVVHENPGQDGGKMRGHLGSQLERKAESNLRLRKSEEITVVFSDKMRGAPIAERDGPRFRWSDDDLMHVSCETAAKTKDDAKREQLRNMLESVYSEAGKPALSWGELCAGIAAAKNIKDGSKIFETASALNVITKGDFGKWSLAA